MASSLNNIFSRIKNEIVFGGHIISLDSPAIILVICILQELPISIIGLIVAYLIPLIVYSYNYQNEFDKDILSDPEKAKFIINRKKIYPLLLGMDIIILALLSLYIFNYGFFGFAIIILTGGILYTTVFKVLTRYIPAFKSIYSTAVWAYAGTFFLLFLYNLEFTYFYIFIFIFIYMRMFVNIAFFDLKDVNADKMHNLKTIPILLGRRNAIKLLNIINFASIIVLLIFIYCNIIPIYAISLSLFFFYTYYYLKKSENADCRSLLNYSYIMADAEFIFWPILLIASKFIYLEIF